MTKPSRALLEDCLSGVRPERVPVSLWRHFPVDDQDPDTLAAATIAWQQSYQFDFVKVTPESAYSVKDWGLEDEWLGNSEGTRQYTKRAIQHPEDWLNLKPLDPSQGRLGDQRTALKAIVSAVGPDTPVVETVFNPLSQVKKLVGDEMLLVHMRKYPDALHAALRTITQTTQDFIKEIVPTGIAGLFFATQHAQYGVLSGDEYTEFGRPYDLQVLETTQDLWLNLLHLHGEDVMFDNFVDYPISVINWHDQDTAPSLVEAKELFSGALCGGWQRQEDIVLGTPHQIQEQAKAAIEATKGERFILGTGCVTPITAPHGNLIAARQAAFSPLS
ncbi:MAG: uroporphyrinogen decarboxylase [Chloroflexi bacterium]|nr:MAG: uroporphyrinogen decarboxylase [Chloroflexota bacterium]MBL1196513.1 uroporphyrinogen decarboxylase [Chloroflexota bacterium]NOH13809.1 uroporphyrinogen decarboxylase [Chloroflexota bacterium]